MPQPHACQRAALAGCPLSPQHWQQHLMWACPTGAFSTSPSHCEYWSHPSPPSRLTCPVQLAVYVASSGPSTPPLSGTSPCCPLAPPLYPAALQEAQCREIQCTCLPGSKGKPGHGTAVIVCLAGVGRGLRVLGVRGAGSREDQAWSVTGACQSLAKPQSAPMSCFREYSPLSLCLNFLHPSLPGLCQSQVESRTVEA